MKEAPPLNTLSPAQSGRDTRDNVRTLTGVFAVVLVPVI